MLRSLKALERFTVRATDGDIGAVVNFLLDDDRWTVRYLVVKAGGLFGGQVLISPVFFRKADWPTQTFHLALRTAKVESSPSIDTDLPVSRQHERDYYRYYDYPYYWASTGIWGAGAHPSSLAAGGWSNRPEPSEEERGDAHLRSAREVTGYHVHGSDGVIGHVADFLVDDETWEVRYLVVDTAHWWAQGRKVLVSPDWATSIRWDDREVRVDLTREVVKSGPEWSTGQAVTREYETRLFQHFGRSAYWDRAGPREAALPSRPAESPRSP